MGRAVGPLGVLSSQWILGRGGVGVFEYIANTNKGCCGTEYMFWVQVLVMLEINWKMVNDWQNDSSIHVMTRATREKAFCQ